MSDTTNTIGFLCTPRVDRILTHEDLGLDLNSFIVFLHSLKFSEKVSLQYCNSSHLIILFKRFLINNEMLDRYETQSLDQYLRNINGILKGS